MAVEGAKTVGGAVAETAKVCLSLSKLDLVGPHLLMILSSLALVPLAQGWEPLEVPLAQGWEPLEVPLVSHTISQPTLSRRARRPFKLVKTLARRDVAECLPFKPCLFKFFSTRLVRLPPA